MPNFGSMYSPDGLTATFRLWSPQATRVELWIYSVAMGADAILKTQMNRQADQSLTYTAQVADLKAAGLGDVLYYGYRAWGPNWTFDAAWTPGSQTGFLSDVDGHGNRFNPNKLLLDPYALEISHNPLTVTQPDTTTYQSGSPFRTIDTGLFAPKGIVIEVQGDFGNKPVRALKDDIIYEVHLRGLTKNDPTIPANLQGTYAGAALKANYFANLGITAVEFQPIHETQNSLNDSRAVCRLAQLLGIRLD